MDAVKVRRAPALRIPANLIGARRRQCLKMFGMHYSHISYYQALPTSKQQGHKHLLYNTGVCVWEGYHRLVIIIKRHEHEQHRAVPAGGIYTYTVRQHKSTTTTREERSGTPTAEGRKGNGKEAGRRRGCMRIYFAS